MELSTSKKKRKTVEKDIGNITKKKAQHKIVKTVDKEKEGKVVSTTKLDKKKVILQQTTQNLSNSMRVAKGRNTKLGKAEVTESVQPVKTAKDVVKKNKTAMVKSSKNVSNVSSIRKSKIVKNENGTKKRLKQRYSVRQAQKRNSISETTQDNEEEFDIKELSTKYISQCITAIFHLTKEQQKDKQDLFDTDNRPIFMQVTCIRVPKVPKRQMRISLPYSIVSDTDDVALFVCDLQRGRRRDYEPTVEHYRELLDKHSSTNIKAIIPMNQVKTEYDQFELKRKLVGSYDHFLVDGRISGHLSHLLGKEFHKKRKFPISVKLDRKDLKHEIDCALKKTGMQLHGLGDTHTVQVGNTAMKKKHIVENIMAVCQYLKRNYPGGWTNIRSLWIKSPLGESIPIYMTLKNKNNVKIPVVKPKRPKAYEAVKGELTTLSGDTNVTVTPEGNVIVERIPNEEDSDAEELNEETDLDMDEKDS